MMDRSDQTFSQMSPSVSIMIKRATAEYFGKFKEAYAELIAQMPEIDEEVNKYRIDAEAMRRKLIQKK